MLSVRILYSLEGERDLSLPLLWATRLSVG